MNRLTVSHVLLSILCASVLAACSNAPAQPTAPAASATVFQPAVTLLPSATAAPIQTAQPSSTPAPTATATPVLSPTPSPKPTPHPLTIDAMRQREYPGSDIVIEETLASGGNYHRYYASYYSEGLKQYGLLTVPFGEKPGTGFPVIIFNHGYIAPSVYRTTERYVAYVDGFARNGFIVFRPDYRGHDQSEGTASGAYGSPGYVVDVLNAFASMQRYPDADPARMGMWGHSMGGYITLRAMVINKEIKAGVIWAGVVASYPDLLARWRRPAAGGAPVVTTTPFPGRGWRSLTAIFGTPEENPQFWDSISANSYLTDLSGPLQLHHGTADTSVPLVFSEILQEQVTNAGEISELYVYQGSDHNLSTGFGLAMQRSIAFFNQHVKGQ